MATEAEYLTAVDLLSFDPNGPHTINVTANIVVARDDDPVYSGTEDLTIAGHGHTISGGSNSRILASTSDDADITLTDLTLANGSAATGRGGAVSVESNLTIENSTLRNNNANDGGGALLTRLGDMAIDNSTLVENHAFGYRGGAVFAQAGNVAIEDSMLADNIANDDGGAVFAAAGNVAIESSTLAGNTANRGGAVVAFDDVFIENSTLTDNTADNDGGAVFAGVGTVVLKYVTLSRNRAPAGADVSTFGGDLDSYASVLADPQRGASCRIAGRTTSTHSYDTDASCGFADTTDTSAGDDPALGPLNDNGGPTLTMLPQPGSPLIDAIPIADCQPDLATDQRGVERPQGRGCDIGSVEV